MAFHIDLRLDCHAQQHEGEDDVKNHQDGDGKPDHEVLIALDLVRERGVAAVEVVAVIIGIGLTTSLNKVVETFRH